MRKFTEETQIEMFSAKKGKKKQKKIKLWTFQM